MTGLLARLAVVLLLLVTSCSDGGGSDDDSGLATLESTSQVGSTAGDSQPDSGDVESALISFAECMRENGFENYPDATLNADGSVGLVALLGQLDAAGIDPQSEQFATSFATCSDRLQGIAFGLIGEGFDQTELQDTLLRFAQCMRDEGINVADPSLSDFGDGTNQGEGPLANVDLDDPEVRAALDICQRDSVFPGLTGTSSVDSDGGDS